MSAGTTELSPRLRGVDVARAVAVLGMVMVHFGPTPAPDTALGWLYELPHGRASVLFVLLAGVGVALLAGGSGEAVPGRRAGARGRLVLRAALLLPLGLWLQGLDHGVLVILQFYAVYFLFAALVLALPDPLLLAVAAVAVVGGAVAYLLAGMAAPGWFDPYPARMGDPSGEVVRELVLSGAYPLAIWSAPLLVGMWIGRRDLALARTGGWLLGGGLALSVAASLLAPEPMGVSGLAELLNVEAHSQMPLWMIGSIGSGCAMLGGALLLVAWLPRATWPLVATGQMALTVYVGHLLLLAANEELVRRETVPDAFLSVGVFAALVACGCVLWRAVLPRGPLEYALAAPWWVVERVLEYLGGSRKTRPGPAARRERGESGT